MRCILTRCIIIARPTLSLLLLRHFGGESLQEMGTEPLLMETGLANIFKISAANLAWIIVR